MRRFAVSMGGPRKVNAVIPLNQCVDRMVYELRSRNLNTGVFVREMCYFVGIRCKWSARFLDQELHFDLGSPCGTARPIRSLVMLPEDIEATQTLGAIDFVTGRRVDFDKPVREGGKGWFFPDTGEASRSIRPVDAGNAKLFSFLENLESSGAP